MANTKSAKKSLRQNEKRRLHNRTRRSALRSTLKKFRLAIEAGDAELATTQFRAVVKVLDKAASKNLLHANAASRLKSRMNTKLKALVTGSAAS